MKELIDIVNKHRTDLYSVYTKELNGIYCDDRPGLQLIYIIEGKIGVKLYDRPVILEEGDIFIFNRFESRFLYSKTMDNLCLILNLPIEAFELPDCSYPDIRFINYIKRDYVVDELVEVLARLYKIYLEEGVLSEDTEDIKILVKLLKYNYINKDFFINGFDEKSSYIEIIEDIVYRNDFDKLNLNYVEDEVHLSPSYISKIFNELSGLKFTEFVQQLKLVYACFTLLYTNQSLDEVSTSVSFNSSRSLNRLFDKYLDMTPSDYRQRYKGRNSGFRFKSKLEEFVRKAGQVDYNNFLKKFRFTYEGKDRIKIFRPCQEEKLFKPWLIVRNLQTIGTDHISIINELASRVNLEEIMLRFDYIEETDSFKFHDLEYVLDETLLALFLNICVENNIRAVISLNSGKLVLTDLGVERKIYIYRKFLNFLENSVGAIGMRRFSYLIDVRDIADYLDQEDLLFKYRDYIAMQHMLIGEFLGDYKYRWGTENGEVDYEKLDKLKKVHERIYDKSTIQPTIISLEYRNNDILSIDSLEQLEKTEDYEKRILDKVQKLKRQLKMPVDRVYIRGIYEHIDISKVDLRYRELFMVQLMLKSIFVLNSDIDIVTDYKVRDIREESGFYYPKILDEFGFYTPIYWSMFLLGQLDGGILYRGNGYIVTKDREDISIIIYGNLLLDYLYASDRDYKDLKYDKYKVDYSIEGLNGKYKITTQVLSYENGSIFYHIGDSKNYKFISRREKDHIKKISMPNYNLEVTEIREDFKDSIYYSPFNIILKKFKKI